MLTISFSCCKNDDDKPAGSENFAEYFTCKINGVEFNPKGTFTCNNLSFYYYQEETGGVSAGSMVIVGNDCPSKKTVAIRINGITPTSGVLNFIEPTYADSCFPGYRQFISGTGELLFESLISGSMDITSFTPRDSITEKLGKIEATFEFSVTNEENDSIIHITEGAFRFKVPNIW